MYSTSLWVSYYLGDLDIYCRLAKQATFSNLAPVVNVWGQIYPIYSSYLPFMVHSQMTEQLNDFQIVTTFLTLHACCLDTTLVFAPLCLAAALLSSSSTAGESHTSPYTILCCLHLPLKPICTQYWGHTEMYTDGSVRDLGAL